MSNNDELIKKIKDFFAEESLKDRTLEKEFSNNVITTAYQRISENITEMIQNEEDPLVLSELLKQYLEITKLVDERGLARQQYLLKLFEQLTKYEQSRYY